MLAHEEKAVDVEKEYESIMPLLTILKTNKFIFLYLIAVTHLFYGYYMTNSFKQFGFTGDLDDKTLSMIGSFGALFNGCFKVFWATLLDYYPFKRVYAIILCI